MAKKKKVDKYEIRARWLCEQWEVEYASHKIDHDRGIIICMTTNDIEIHDYLNVDYSKYGLEE